MTPIPGTSKYLRLLKEAVQSLDQKQGTLSEITQALVGEPWNLPCEPKSSKPTGYSSMRKALLASEEAGSGFHRKGEIWYYVEPADSTVAYPHVGLIPLHGGLTLSQSVMPRNFEQDDQYFEQEKLTATVIKFFEAMVYESFTEERYSKFIETIREETDSLSIKVTSLQAFLHSKDASSFKAFVASRPLVQDAIINNSRRSNENDDDGY